MLDFRRALPTLAAELVAMGVVAIAATGDVASARAAQLASNTVPVVFTIGGDPIRHGLVESINRPGRHVTGILFNPNVLGAKRVELLHEIAPDISRIALLMNLMNLALTGNQQFAWLLCALLVFDLAGLLFLASVAKLLRRPRLFGDFH